MSTAEFDRQLAGQNLAGLWTAPVRGHQPETPFLWPWSSVREGLMRAKDEVGMEAAERRVIKLVNPHLATTTSSRTVQFNYQLVNPGEVARAHRHSLAAIRFVIEGRGAYTTVESERCDMEPGDFILTPAWTWHDHYNEGDRPIIWLDGLDGPVVQALNLALFEGSPTPSQPIRKTTSEFRVPWTTAYAALQNAAEDACDGQVYRYPAMPTLASELSRLRAGVPTKTHRHTSVAMYHVYRGEGSTTIDDEVLEWRQGDTFVVPAWRWHRHEARGSEAILFSMNDGPAIRALGLYREEQR